MESIGKPTRIDNRNRIVLNAKILQKLSAGEGDYIFFVEDNGNIAIKKGVIMLEQDGGEA